MENFMIYNGGVDFCNCCTKKKGEYTNVKLKVQVATYIYNRNF